MYPGKYGNVGNERASGTSGRTTDGPANMPSMTELGIPNAPPTTRV